MTRVIDRLGRKSSVSFYFLAFSCRALFILNCFFQKPYIIADHSSENICIFSVYKFCFMTKLITRTYARFTQFVPNTRLIVCAVFEIINLGNG